MSGARSCPASAHDLKTPLAAITGHAQLLRRAARAAGPAPPVDTLLAGPGQIEAARCRWPGSSTSWSRWRRWPRRVPACRPLRRIWWRWPATPWPGTGAWPAPTRWCWRSRRRRCPVSGTRRAWSGCSTTCSPTRSSTARKAAPSPCKSRPWGRVAPGGRRAPGTRRATRARATRARATRGAGRGGDQRAGPGHRHRRGRPARMSSSATTAGTSGNVVGSGVGLTSVKHIVEQHGGAVDIASSEGDGTTVSVWLPLRPPAGRAARRGQATRGAEARLASQEDAAR